MEKKNVMNVSIEGPIGVGKSTLLKHLKENIDNCIVEPQHFEKIKELLDNFYKGKRESKDIVKLQEAIIKTYNDSYKKEYDNDCKIRIFEACTSSDKVFTEISYSKNELNKDDYDYLKKEHSIESYGIKIDYIIYLYADIKVLEYRNQNDKTRINEKNIETEYLKQIHEKYEEYLKTINPDCLLKIDTTNKNTEEISNQIKEFLKNKK